MALDIAQIARVHPTGEFVGRNLAPVAGAAARTADIAVVMAETADDRMTYARSLTDIQDVARMDLRAINSVPKQVRRMTASDAAAAIGPEIAGVDPARAVFVGNRAPIPLA